MDFKSRIIQQLTEQLAHVFPDAQLPHVHAAIEIPPTPDMGDYAYPCFPLAKILRKAPPAIAAQIAQEFPLNGFLSKVEAKGGYVNFFITREIYAQEILSKVLREGPSFGSCDQGEGGTVCLDYSSINISKRFHIGHLMTTAIGNALKNIYAHCGYTPVSINHLGDWGTQFGKLISAYKRWVNQDALQIDPMNELQRIYVLFHNEAEKDPALNEEGRAWFKRIEEGDPEALKLFEYFKSVTLKDCQRVYDLMGVTFDSYNGESFYNDKMQPIVDELAEKGLLIESDGAQIVDLSEFDMPPCLILKSDGATLYATRDLATAVYRKNTYNFKRSLYVVAEHQQLHFRQFFTVLKLLGYEWAEDMEHVSYGMVSMEEGSLSTRHGRVVLLEDLFTRSIEKARDTILNSGKASVDMDLDKVAQTVGVGAVIFQALYNNRVNNLVFSWERALNFDGETGPYVQYTHARCCSVLRKAGDYTPENFQASQLQDDRAMEIVRQLERFGETVLAACNRNEPSLVARYAVDLAQAFNRFYYENRILTDEPETTQARLCVTQCVRQVLHIALGLLGIQAPEQM